MVKYVIDVVSNKKLSVKKTTLYRTILRSFLTPQWSLFMSENQDIQNNPSPDLQINCIPLKTGLLNHHETSMYILAEFSTGPMPTHVKEKTRTPIALSIVSIGAQNLFLVLPFTN